MEGATYAWTDTPRGSICEIIAGKYSEYNTFVRWPDIPAGKCDCAWLPTGYAEPSWQLESGNDNQGRTRVLVDGLTADQCRAVCLRDKATAIAMGAAFARARVLASNAVGDIVKLSELTPGTLAVLQAGADDCVVWPDGMRVVIEPGDWKTKSDAHPAGHGAADPTYRVLATGLDDFACSAMAGVVNPVARREIAYGDYVPVWDARVPCGSIWTSIYEWGVKFANGRVACGGWCGGWSFAQPGPNDFKDNPYEAYVRVEFGYTLSDRALQDFLVGSSHSKLLTGLARSLLVKPALIRWVIEQAAWHATRFVTSTKPSLHVRSFIEARIEAALTTARHEVGGPLYNLRDCGLYAYPLPGGRFVGTWSYGTHVYESLLDLLLSYIESPPDHFDVVAAMFDGDSPDFVDIGAGGKSLRINRPTHAYASEFFVGELVSAQIPSGNLPDCNYVNEIATSDTVTRLIRAGTCQISRSGPWPVCVAQDADTIVVWNFGTTHEMEMRAAAQSTARGWRSQRTKPRLDVIYLTAAPYEDTV